MATRLVTPLSAAIDRQLYLKGLTRNDLAKRTGVSYNYISLILRGQYKPTIEMARKMADVLQMDAAALRELALKKAV